MQINVKNRSIALIRPWIQIFTLFALQIKTLFALVKFNKFAKIIHVC